MWPAITSKKQTPGVDWNVLLHFHEAKLSELATTPANCGRRKTDLGKSTLLFRLQRKGGTIGLPLIRNSRWLAARCWSVLQHRETLFSFLFFFIPPISAAIPDKWRGGRDGLGGEVGRLLLNALFEPGAPASSSILTCKLAKIKRELLTRMPGISAGGGNSYSTRSLSKEAFPINVLACNVFCSTSVFFIHASTV